MLKKERQREILKVVETTGKAEVGALAQRFAVTEMTIRRDLSELGKQGLLERVHGGALIQNDRRANELPVYERLIEQLEVKRQIGQAVAGLIQDGEKIFLGSGSTTMAVAEALSNHRNLTVYTNALNIADALFHYPVKVVMLGGSLRRSEMSLIGDLTEKNLQGLRVDKVILGMRGIDPVKGLTSDHMEELLTDQAILNIGKTIIVVADHSKIGHVAAIRTAPISAVTRIVTDKGGPKDILQAIRRMGVEILEV
jgi:DeoR family transcriptional regulator of aga operon/DeoR family fructose operon transcriptional repressor